MHQAIPWDLRTGRKVKADALALFALVSTRREECGALTEGVWESIPKGSRFGEEEFIFPPDK